MLACTTPDSSPDGIGVQNDILYKALWWGPGGTPSKAP